MTQDSNSPPSHRQPSTTPASSPQNHTNNNNTTTNSSTTNPDDKGANSEDFLLFDEDEEVEGNGNDESNAIIEDMSRQQQQRPTANASTTTITTTSTNSTNSTSNTQPIDMPTTTGTSPNHNISPVNASMTPPMQPQRRHPLPVPSSPHGTTTPHLTTVSNSAPSSGNILRHRAAAADGQMATNGRVPMGTRGPLESSSLDALPTISTTTTTNHSTMQHQPTTGNQSTNSNSNSNNTTTHDPADDFFTLTEFEENSTSNVSPVSPQQQQQHNVPQKPTPSPTQQQQPVIELQPEDPDDIFELKHPQMASSSPRSPGGGGAFQHQDTGSSSSGSHHHHHNRSLFPTVHSNQSFERILLLHPEFRKKVLADNSFYSYKYLKSNSFANRYQFMPHAANAEDLQHSSPPALLAAAGSNSNSTTTLENDLTATSPPLLESTNSLDSIASLSTHSNNNNSNSISSRPSSSSSSSTLNNNSQSDAATRQQQFLEDKFKREMRGIVYNHAKQRVVSRPFHKFFSVNENAESHESNIQKKIQSGQKYWLLEKLDGHMVLCLLWNGELRFRTQMSIDNKITQSVENMVYGSLEKKPEPSPKANGDGAPADSSSQSDRSSRSRRFSLEELKNQRNLKHFPANDLHLYEGPNRKFLDFSLHWIQQDYSPIFEFFSKQHRVVVEYEHEGLVLLSLRDNATGHYMPYDHLVEEAEKFDIPIVKQWKTTIKDVKDLLSQVKSQTGVEGYVLRFEDGDMYKIKTLWYTDLQKTKSLLKWNGILESYPWKLVLECKVDDAIPLLNTDLEREHLLKFNDELLDAIEHAAQRLVYIVNSGRNNSSSRKGFVKYVKQNFPEEHPQFLSCVYEMYSLPLNTDPTTLIMNHLKQMVQTPDTCRAFLKSEVRFTLPKDSVNKIGSHYMKNWNDEKHKVRQAIKLAVDYLSEQKKPIDYIAVSNLLSQLKDNKEDQYKADIEKVHFILEKYGWDTEESRFKEAQPDAEKLRAEFYSFLSQKDPENSAKLEIVNMEPENIDGKIGDELMENMKLGDVTLKKAGEEKESPNPTKDSGAASVTSESSTLTDTEASNHQDTQKQSNGTLSKSSPPPESKDNADHQAEQTFAQQKEGKKTPEQPAKSPKQLATTHTAPDTRKRSVSSSVTRATAPPSMSERRRTTSSTAAPLKMTSSGSSHSQSLTQTSPLAKRKLPSSNAELDGATFDQSNTEYVTYGQEHKEKIRQVNQYILGEKLGSGTYGKVVEAIDSKSLRRVAIKIMKRIRLKKIKGAEKRLKNEILINQKLKHQNVIEFYEVIHDETKGKIYLVIEFAGAGSLSQVIDSQSNQKLPLPDVHHFFRQLVKGLEYIHSQGVVHLDIKPDNLMISPDRVLKISDFGVSYQFKLFEGDRCKTFYGTPTFASPEIASGKEFSGEKADIWACGVTLYYLITGKYPFEGESVFQLYENIGKGNYEMPDYIPEDLQDFLSKLLEPNEEKRPTAAELKKHPWFMGDDRVNREPLVDRWRSFSLSQTISKALHNSNLYHMSFKVDGTEPSDMAELDRDKCTIL